MSTNLGYLKLLNTCTILESCRLYIANVSVFLSFQQAGLPSLDGCQLEAEKLRTLVDSFECVKYYLLSNTPEVGLEMGLKYVKGMYKAQCGGGGAYTLINTNYLE